MEDLTKLREEMDKADEALLTALEQRMKVAQKIGNFKKSSGKPIYDGLREREKLSAIYDKADELTQPFVPPIYSLLFEISRSIQSKLIQEKSEDALQVEKVIENMSSKAFPVRAVVACQGIEGAFSQEACEKLFQIPSIMFMKNFSQVFSAIESGLCKYGVLPVENSNAGTVSAVYDQMIQHHFKIVRAIRVKVDHNCLMLPGSKMSDIKEVISHEQALNQCREFIKNLGPDVKVTACQNTAEAAKIVSTSGRNDICCLSSKRCSSLYNLENMKSSVQDSDNNYTRFIVISKDLEIYPGANRSSMMMILNHEPGSLYRILAFFYSRGINLVKLESRPLPGRMFEFMFYFDLETSIYNEGFAEMIADLHSMTKEFRYLGSYNEVV